MKTLVAFLCCVAAAAAFPATKEEQNLEWSAWKKFHGKTYASETEEAFRSAVWLNNMKVSHTLRGNIVLYSFTTVTVKHLLI